MKKPREIKDYDELETTSFIDKSKRMGLSDIGFHLPEEAPTKVISIRLPKGLYNGIRAYSTNMDMP